MFSVFLSHSSHDSEFMFKVSRQLDSVGIKSYLYQYDQRPGHQVIDKIHENIVTSDVLIAMLTPNGAKSEYVQHEISYALAKERLVIPLLHPDAPLPAVLAGCEYIPLHPETTILNLQTYLQKLSEKKANAQMREEVLIGLVIIAGIIGVAYLASITGSSPEIPGAG